MCYKVLRKEVSMISKEEISEMNYLLNTSNVDVPTDKLLKHIVNALEHLGGCQSVPGITVNTKQSKE